MSDQVYYKLREVLDTIPNGFPATDSGVEIKLLKKIFTEEEAGLAVQLKLHFESVDDIAKRTGLDRGYLDAKLREMGRKGQLFRINFAGTPVFKLLPFVFGIYEFQLPRLDREFAELFDEYADKVFRKEFFSHTPALMKVVPVGVEVAPESTVEPYESVVKLIEGAKSWMVNDCICKKEKALMGHRCDRPMEVCLAFAPVENAFDRAPSGRAITKEEAYRILKQAEEAGLVHMTSNTATGHIYICNCCECCCLPLSSIRKISRNATAASNYRAVVDRELCTACGICADRCQAGAVEIGDCAVIGDCIGCGLCSTTCPASAIRMVRVAPDEEPAVPRTELEWFAERAKSRGSGDGYKGLL